MHIYMPASFPIWTLYCLLLNKLHLSIAEETDDYTPVIYAEGYIVFVFPFVRLYVRSFVLPSRL